jgi:hypothetical protein
MKNRKISRIALATFALSVTALGCGHDDNVTKAFNQKEIQSGTYSSERCFLNKIETEVALGAKRWSMATLVFNDDHTGSGHFVTFTDAACTAQVSDSTFTFNNASQESIGGVAVIKFHQTGTVINPDWWLPNNLSDHGYSFDVDFTDGESGPYIVEPTPTQLTSFGANPGQGVSFKRQ